MEAILGIRVSDAGKPRWTSMRARSDRASDNHSIASIVWGAAHRVLAASV
jgi:hypothetical protein